MLSLPDVRQESNWDCGRAALKTVCAYWNKPLPLFIANLSNEVAGLSPDTLEAAFRALQLKVISGSWTIDLLRAVTKEGIPVVCLVQMDGIGHWIVVRGVQRNRVYYQCPENGSVSEKVDEFDRNWIDYHFLGATYDRWALAAYVD